MSLLSSGDIDSILGAIQQVTDTFFVTPLVYEHRGESLDAFGEDRTDEVVTTWNLNCLFEAVSSGTDQGDQMRAGFADKAEIKVTFNLADLALIAGIVNLDNSVNFNPATDYFTVKGTRYRVIPPVFYDGPLTARDVLVTLYGKKDEVAL